MCEKYERCQHTSSTRKFKKIERGVKLCAGRNTCLATAQQAVCILLAARNCCGHATTSFGGYLSLAFYSPQCSCGKVMFLHVSVILSTRGVSARHPLGQTPPGQTLPLGRHPLLGRHSPSDSHCSRWSESYWNAFLSY